MLAMSLLLVGRLRRQAVALHSQRRALSGLRAVGAPLRGVLLPLLRRMGLEAELSVRRPGYVPEGNGILEVRVRPAKAGLRPLVLTEQGKVTAVRGIALSSHLAEQEVSDRMADECSARLEEAGYDADIEAVYETSASQKGADLTVWIETDSGAVIGSDRAGKLGRRSEEIGRYVAEGLLDDLKTGATVDRYAADQLIPFCALAGGTSEYVIPCVTEHVETNLWLVETILGAGTGLDGRRLRIEGVGHGLGAD